MFNVGDRVIVHRPRNGIQNFPDEPTWVSNMDQYDGTEQRISYIYNDGRWVELVGQLYTYDRSWLSPVPVVEDEFEVEDLWHLM